MVECNGQTTHFSSGCELLKHYDADEDGTLSMTETMQSNADARSELITVEELEFVTQAWLQGEGGINKLCPGCYAREAGKSLWLVLGAALIGLYLYLKR